MWIRSQNKKQLINVIKVEIGSIVGDKRCKVVIWGRFAPDGLFSSNKSPLGTYPTMENANSEVNEIEKAISNNPNGVYNMKNNE